MEEAPVKQTTDIKDQSYAEEASVERSGDVKDQSFAATTGASVEQSSESKDLRPRFAAAMEEAPVKQSTDIKDQSFAAAMEEAPVEQSSEIKDLRPRKDAMEEASVERSGDIKDQSFAAATGASVEKSSNIKDLRSRKVVQVHATEKKDPYFTARMSELMAEMAKGENPYAQTFSVSMSIPEYIELYKNISAGACVEGTETSLAGRITSKRSASSKLLFYDVHGEGSKVQILACASDSSLTEDEFSSLHKKVKCGDIVGVSGITERTKRGELTLRSRDFAILSLCLYMLPDKDSNTEPKSPGQPRKSPGQPRNATKDKKIKFWSPGQPRNPMEYTLKDQEIRYRQRYLDLLVNSDVRKILIAKSDTTNFIRSYLTNKKFVEVETPVMNLNVGGGVARPFSVHFDGHDTKMFLRIAPELYLKQLVVGGFDRVFEIGKQFRNEGIDMTHNPEFTSCEFYMAYASYRELMKMTEDLLSSLVKKITGGFKVKYHADGYDKEPVEIDFTPPYKRVDMIEELKKAAGLEIPSDLASEEANKYLIEACGKLKVNCPHPQTTARLLDKLVGKYLEDECVNPTFIINHPVIMSPFAKEHISNESVTERFELYIVKQELCNAYTELTNPVVQRERFNQLVKDRQAGDEEATVLDESFCLALEHGLPPTAGWGIGIDRLTMILTDSINIKEVLTFPTMREDSKLKDKSKMQNKS